MNAIPPTVTVTPISNDANDLTHCEIRIGEKVITALFTEPHTELAARVQEIAEVELTVDEIMTVTQASRHQMEREGERLKTTLLAMPACTVACVDGAMYFWLDTEKRLAWEQGITIGEGELNPGDISDIGEIDTEELWELAVSIRKWLREPVTVQADLQWLHQQNALNNVTN